MEGYQFFGVSLVVAILGSALFGLVLRVAGAIVRGRNVGHLLEIGAAIAIQAIAALYFSVSTFHDLLNLISELEHPILMALLSLLFPIVLGLYACTYASSLFMLILCYRAGEIAYDKLFPGLVAKRENESWRRVDAQINERIKSERARLRK